MSLYFIKNKIFQAPRFSDISFYSHRLEVKDTHVSLRTVGREYNRVKRPVTAMRNREVHLECTATSQRYGCITHLSAVIFGSS